MKEWNEDDNGAIKHFLKCQISVEDTASLLLFIEMNLSERIPQCNLIFFRYFISFYASD